MVLFVSVVKSTEIVEDKGACGHAGRFGIRHFVISRFGQYFIELMISLPEQPPFILSRIFDHFSFPTFVLNKQTNKQILI